MRCFLFCLVKQSPAAKRGGRQIVGLADWCKKENQQAEASPLLPPIKDKHQRHTKKNGMAPFVRFFADHAAKPVPVFLGDLQSINFAKLARQENCCVALFFRSSQAQNGRWSLIPSHQRIIFCLWRHALRIWPEPAGIEPAGSVAT